MKGILQIVGPHGVGKTTLCDLLIHELAPAPILVIDASPDQQLTRRLTLDANPRHTLGQLVRTYEENPAQPQEGIDWAFRDLAVSVGSEVDLLSVGAIPGNLSPKVAEKLAYGLNRLMDEYDFILIDGFQPALASLIQTREMVRFLAVATPTNYQLDLAAFNSLRTPVLILNRVAEGPLPEALDAALTPLIEKGELKLVGKLPNYANPDERIRELPTVFHNCLLRLDLPLQHSSNGA